MDTSKLIKKIEEIESKIPKNSTNKDVDYNSFYLLTLQFVKNYIGEKTVFYNSLINFTKKYNDNYLNKLHEAEAVLNSIKAFLNLNLDFSNTESYKIKIDVISDFIEQSIQLASDNKYHPAASAILLGAALEEFLKNLAEQHEIDLSNINRTIDPITKKLYENNIITKQDLKDITSWAGLRNDATHGNFDEVNDRNRIKNAIEGVNLFMRKYIN